MIRAFLDDWHESEFIHKHQPLAFQNSANSSSQPFCREYLRVPGPITVYWKRGVASNIPNTRLVDYFCSLKPLQHGNVSALSHNPHEAFFALKNDPFSVLTSANSTSWFLHSKELGRGVTFRMNW